MAKEDSKTTIEKHTKQNQNSNEINANHLVSNKTFLDNFSGKILCPDRLTHLWTFCDSCSFSKHTDAHPS